QPLDVGLGGRVDGWQPATVGRVGRRLDGAEPGRDVVAVLPLPGVAAVGQPDAVDDGRGAVELTGAHARQHALVGDHLGQRHA
ncbi:hypothetical protein DF186_21375, partial [Enterococcus hirae]